MVLYPDRAVVTRIINLADKPQSGTLRFSDLPYTLIPESVRAGSQGANITGVAIRKNLDDVSQWDNHPTKKKIDSTDAEIKKMESEVSVYREQLSLLSNFGQLTTAQTDKDTRNASINTDKWAEALAFIETKKVNYLAKMRKLDKQLYKTRQEYHRLNRQFSGLSHSRKSAESEVMVSYSKGDSSRNEVFLEYQVGSVSWTGLYDLKSTSDSGEFQLITQAIIRQTTGEEWQNVNLSLSTARPSSGTSPGLLNPWRLSASTIGGPHGKNKGDSNRSNVVGSLTEEDSSMGGATAEDFAEATVFTVNIPGKETIASDGADHKVALNSANLKGTMSHVAIPSLSGFVYLKARIRNTGGSPILWGNMNIFLDGNFVGNQALRNRVAGGEEFDVYFGPDQRMQIKRTLVKGDVEGSGLFSKKVNIINKWQIELANYSKKNKQITIYDQYPVPADPNLAISFEGSSRKDVSADSNGILTWKLDLKPSEQMKFDFSYTLSIPRETWDSLLKQQEARYPQESQDYMQQKNAPSPARQYNLEKMFQKR